MDEILDKIAALGVPGLVLLVAMAVTGYAGAAAITAALAALGGPFGMLGGVAVLGILGLMSKGLADFGFEEMFKGTVKRLNEQGISKSDIELEIESYPISRTLKLKIKDYLNNEQADFKDLNQINPDLKKVIERIECVPGMTKSQTEFLDMNDVVTQFNLRDNQGKVILTKNLAGVYHVRIMNPDRKTLFFGYVGWIHVNGLCKEVYTIRAEFS